MKALRSEPESELRRLLMQALPPADRVLLEGLAGACGATLAVERLRALSGIEDAAPRLERLHQAGLVESGSPRYRLAGALSGLEVEGSRQKVARDLVEFARADGRAGEEVAAELPAACALIEWANDEQRDALAIALGRAFAPAAFHGRRWSAWGEVLAAVEHAARRSGDHAALGWALHQRGTRTYAQGDPASAVASLREALAVRLEAHDEDGAAATRHNLDFILGPSGSPPDADHEPPPPGPRGRWIGFAAVAAALLVMAAGIALALRSGEDESKQGKIRVPDVRGAVAHAARATLRRAELKPVTRGNCAGAASCLVREQSPGPGRKIARGARVRLRVAETNRPLVPVPELEAKTRNQARAALRAVDLPMRASGACRPELPRIFEGDKCRVRSSLPAAGRRVPAGSPVQVTFKGAAPAPRVTVPQLAGKRLASIQEAIDGSRLRLQVAGSCGAGTGIIDAADCLAEKQDPAAGESVASGSTVTVTFGSQVVEVAVPGVVGMTCTAATQAVSAATLKSSGCQSPGDVVVSSDPAAGAMVAQGSSVDLATQTPEPKPSPVP